MIRKDHQDNDTYSYALYSDCETYRYGLARRWGEGAELLYIMLNPSKATELANDPTIERCQRRAVQLGFGGMRIANLFGLRATYPEDLRRVADPVGPENDALVQEWAAEAGQVLAAWGVHGALMGRGPALAQHLHGDICHLGLTKDGHPRHPLYVSYKVQPTPWRLNERYASG